MQWYSGVTIMTRNHVLFVDDDVLNQWLVTDCLTTLGFAVTGLCRGADAVEMLEQGHDFDLLLTDLHMPDGMTGFELAEHWRRTQPGRPILYTSTYPQFAVGMLEGDEGFIRKHADASAMLAAIDALLIGPCGRTPPVSTRRPFYVH
jgi:CheY-like chemotaxis protein